MPSAAFDFCETIWILGVQDHVEFLDLIEGEIYEYIPMVMTLTTF